MNTLRERGWWYDVEWTRCERCRGSGERVECYDDLCHAKGRCMHEPGNNVCNLCDGTGRITKELDERWYSRDSFESVTAPDADLWNQRKLHAVARERRQEDEPVATDGGRAEVDSTTPQAEEYSDELREAYKSELREKRPDAERRRELRSEHRHHLVRETTSQYSTTKALNGPVEMKKTAEIPDLYCFTCEEWVGLSGVDLRGTPRSRKDAYYLGGPPEEVVEARQTVRDTLADLVTSVVSTVPRADDAEDAFDFIEAEQQKARERVREANDAE